MTLSVIPYDCLGNALLEHEKLHILDKNFVYLTYFSNTGWSDALTLASRYYFFKHKEDADRAMVDKSLLTEPELEF